MFGVEVCGELRSPECRQLATRLQWSIYAVEVCGLLVCAHTKRPHTSTGVPSQWPIGPVGDPWVTRNRRTFATKSVEVRPYPRRVYRCRVYPPRLSRGRLVSLVAR